MSYRGTSHRSRVLNALAKRYKDRLGTDTFPDPVQFTVDFTPHDLLAIPGLGIRALEEIQVWLAENGQINPMVNEFLRLYVIGRLRIRR